MLMPLTKSQNNRTRAKQKKMEKAFFPFNVHHYKMFF